MNAIACLPTYNEVESIELMIDAIEALGLPLFVTDGGSTDGTRDIISKKGIELFDREKGSGKGAGIQKALDVAKEKGYEWIVFTDCDMTYPVDSIPNLLAVCEDQDMVVGVRSMQDIAFLRRLGNLLFIGLINTLFRAKLTDVVSGMRAVKVSSFQGKLNSLNFEPEIEMTCMALKKGYKIKEIPISYRSRKGKSKIGLSDLFVLVNRIFKEWKEK